MFGQRFQAQRAANGGHVVSDTFRGLARMLGPENEWADQFAEQAERWDEWARLLEGGNGVLTADYNIEAPSLAGDPLIAVRREALRNASGMSRGDTARMLGVDKRDVRAWENGEPIPAEFIPVLADRFGGISIAHLLGEGS
jgi:hypothetical protein